MSTPKAQPNPIEHLVNWKMGDPIPERGTKEWQLLDKILSDRVTQATKALEEHNQKYDQKQKRKV